MKKVAGHSVTNTVRVAPDDSIPIQQGECKSDGIFQIMRPIFGGYTTEMQGRKLANYTDEILWTPETRFPGQWSAASCLACHNGERLAH